MEIGVWPFARERVAAGQAMHPMIPAESTHYILLTYRVRSRYGAIRASERARADGRSVAGGGGGRAVVSNDQVERRLHLERCKESNLLPTAGQATRPWASRVDRSWVTAASDKAELVE